MAFQKMQVLWLASRQIKGEAPTWVIISKGQKEGRLKEEKSWDELPINKSLRGRGRYKIIKKKRIIIPYSNQKNLTCAFLIKSISQENNV